MLLSIAMPRKTKRQKILADIHKQKTPTIEYKFEHTAKELPLKPPAVAASDILDYSYVKWGLLKILFFTIIAMTFQGVLYFMLNRG